MAAPAPAAPYFVPENVRQAQAQRAALRAARAGFKEVYRTRAREEVASGRERIGRKLTPYTNANVRRARAIENIEYEKGRNISARNAKLATIRAWTARVAANTVTSLANRGLYRTHRKYYISELNRLMRMSEANRARNNWSRGARLQEAFRRMKIGATAARGRAGATAGYGGRLALRGLAALPRGIARGAYSAALLPGVQGGRAKLAARRLSVLGEYETEGGRRGTLIALRRELNNANAALRNSQTAFNTANRAVTVANRARNNAVSLAARAQANNAARNAANAARNAANAAVQQRTAARTARNRTQIIRGRLQEMYNILNRGQMLNANQRARLNRLLAPAPPGGPAVNRRARRNELFAAAGMAPPRRTRFGRMMGGAAGGRRNRFARVFGL